MKASPEETMQALGTMAREGKAPSVDVTQSVLRSIGDQAVVDENPMLWFAGASSVCATVVGYYCLFMIDALHDPLALMFTVLPGGTL